LATSELSTEGIWILPSEESSRSEWRALIGDAGGSGKRMRPTTAVKPMKAVLSSGI
jgi:hypothetical protein